MKAKSIVISLLLVLFGTPTWAAPKTKQETRRVITIDYRQEKGKFNTFFKECVGAGRANEGLRADWQQQLRLVREECGFRYIRMHGLLCDDMGVYREDRTGNPQYNYQYIDVLYDFILSIGMKPFVELGFMPSALASGDRTIFWWKGNVTPPKDYQRWEKLIEHLVRHFTDRYGPEEVKSWYFEVWNEPNLTPYFWTGTQDDYFKLYKHAAQAIKRVNPAYRVGGPATAGAAWESELIEFCHKNNVPIDFISTHSYGVEAGYLDQYGETGTILSKDPWSVSKDVIESRREIAASPMPHLELHYTEWSSSYTPADPIHDSYHQAAYILEKIKQVGDAAQSMSYWVFTDIFEEAGPRFTPFHGGFGLLNYQGIKKPAYHAFAFLNKMGEIELANNDTRSRACKNENGDLQILCWDFTFTLPDSINNQDYYIRDLPARPKGTLALDVNGIPQGKYILETYRIGYQHNDPYSSYIQLNRPDQLTPLQVEFLKNQSSGQPTAREIIEINPQGQYRREVPLHENDVYLFVIKKL